MNFKGIIFDLDGTLVNSLEDLADSMNNVLHSYGFSSHPLRAYKYFIGNGIKNLVREALPEASQEEGLIERCFDLMMEDYRNNCTNKTQPYDGIKELLNELSARKMKLAVLSNKIDELTRKVVTVLLPDSNFEVVMGVQPGIPRKPDPKGALLVSRSLGICPEDLIYLGDTGVDMQAANNAGAYAVGALWGFRTKEELILNGARHLLNHPLELILMLDQI